jgi:hypothetical protein
MALLRTDFMNYRVILGCCLMVTLCQGVAAAKVYTWTDEKGVTHYGEHPPQGATAKKINARTGHSEPTPTETPATPEKSPTPSAEQAPQSTKDPERCEIAKKNLETLKSNARVRVPDGNGNTRFLLDEERQSKVDETEKVIEESCE